MAAMLPGVKLLPLTNSPATSSRGTVVKAPISRPSAATLDVVSSLVIAWARIVPVLRRPPVAAAGLQTPPATTPRQVKLTAEDPWMATASELISGSVGWPEMVP